jgi:hypothetical protein
VSAGVIFDSQMTDSGAKDVLFGRKDSIVAAKSKADKRRKCLQNKADGIF